jgi:hypothetical protein
MPRGASGSCAGFVEALLALALVSSLPACKERRDAEDARAILSAYEAFQNASPTDRRAALDALAHATCRDPESCADRDACAGYGAALVRATELTSKARSLSPVDAGGNGAATAEELAIIVAGAEEAVNEAERVEPTCSAALQRLADRRAKVR